MNRPGKKGPAIPAAGGFTLVEMMASITVFAILVGFLAYIVNGVQKAWIQGDQRVEIFQSARAALELFSRELSGAVVSDRIQFVQSPNLGQLSGGSVPNLAPNSPSLFWMAPGKSTPKGNLCEYGYYLTRNDGASLYQLNRMYVAPDTATPAYYLGANAYDLGVDPKKTWSFANEALWITKMSKSAFDPSNSSRVVSVVADGILAMWIRCLDPAGNAIPWLCKAPGYSQYPTNTIQFNSGSCFQMTTAAAPFSSAAAGYSNPEKTFQYTASPVNTTNTAVTKVSNALPPTVEITLIVADSRTLRQAAAAGRTIPFMPSLSASTADDIPTQIQNFNQDLLDRGVNTARTFTARVRTLNGLP